MQDEKYEILVWLPSPMGDAIVATPESVQLLRRREKRPTSSQVAAPSPSSNEVQPQILVDEDTPGGDDGNNVNMEDEMNSMRQNRLLYETYASILSSRFEVLRASIQDGR